MPLRLGDASTERAQVIAFDPASDNEVREAAARRAMLEKRGFRLRESTPCSMTLVPPLREPHLGVFRILSESGDDRLARSLDKKLDHDCRIEKVSVQYIVGKDATPEALEGVLLACAEHRFRVTLLGYKNVGRGPAFGEKPSAGWLDVVRRVAKACHLRIGIDTALADRWWDALIEAGVPAWSMARVEGAFSCYVDAVAGTIAPSSYTGEAVKLAPNFNDLCEKFAAFPAA